jgi:hypothetical protein
MTMGELTNMDVAEWASNAAVVRQHSADRGEETPAVFSYEGHSFS